jgi:deoxyribonuclease IV
VTEEALAALGGRRIGLHLPLGGGMVKTADRAAAIGATAIQVFSDNPTAWRRRADPPAELPAFRDRLQELDIAPISVHGPYLVNLAGADTGFWEKSVDTLIGDLAMARQYGATFLNIHVGSHRGAGAAAGIKRMAEGLSRVLAQAADVPATPRLVLENSAGGGDGVGGTIEELSLMLEAAIQAGVVPSRIGFCLDTAHLWGAGYEVSQAEVVDEVLREFDARLGADQLAIVHLNDSRSALGSHADRHEHLGAGLIGAAGLAAFLAHPRLRAVPFFAEPPGMDEGFDAVNMDRIRLLIRGEALPALGPEAFVLKKSRTRGAHPKPADSGGGQTADSGDGRRPAKGPQKRPGSAQADLGKARRTARSPTPGASPKGHPATRPARHARMTTPARHARRASRKAP